MSDVSTWSTNDADNDDPTKSGMPEGMPRSDVNNRGREHLGAIRRWYENSEWVDLLSGSSSNFALSRVNVTTFRVADVVSSGTDASSKFSVGSWVRITVNTGTRYGSVVSSTYTSPMTDVVLTDIMDAAFDNTNANGEIPSGTVTKVEVYAARRVKSAAFSKVGVTLAQTPAEIPSIDLLQPHVLKPEGHTTDDSGINADRLDGYHALDLIDRDNAFHTNVMANGNFSSWSAGTSFSAAPTTGSNADEALLADNWYLASDGDDRWDVERVSVTITDQPPSNPLQTHALRLTAQQADGGKGGIFSIVSRDLVRSLQEEKDSGGNNYLFSLSFWAKSDSGDQISSIRASVCPWISSSDPLTQTPPATSPVSSWGADGSSATLSRGSWRSYTSASMDSMPLTTSWQKYTVENLTYPGSGMYRAGVLIYTDNATYGNQDRIYIAGVQLEPGPEVTSFNYPPASLSLAENLSYRTDSESGEVNGTYFKSSPNLDLSSGSAGMPSTFVDSEAHGFNRVPRLVKCVLVCRIAHLGWVVGDEVDYASIRPGTSSGGQPLGASFGANETDVFVNVYFLNECKMVGPNGTQASFIIPANWNLYVRAWR